MFPNSSHIGAAAARRGAKRNPMAVLANLIEADPTLGKEALFERWFSTIEDDEDMRRAVGMHAFTNMYEAFERDRRQQQKPATATKRIAPATVVQRAAALANRVKEAVLMNLVLPSGKKLKDATFGECAKAGGWFVAVSKKGKPHQLVGDILSELDLKAIKI